ncbi:MAG TPA: M20/M25/M40 family metallo-hydrolase [Chloroflexota bacterium]|nr:M20/M25/M40 family metallo-hydrolase [Chloroflexota bacterium]
MSRAIELAEALIRIASPNPPSEERAVAEALATWLRGVGIEAEVLGVGASDAPQANVFARVRGSGELPPLVLSGHLDTVPAGEGAWRRDPLNPERRDGRLYGLGAADMKGAVAAMCVAAARVAATAAERPLRGDLLLAFTSGEETGSAGARALARSGRLDGAGGIVIGEPTANRVGIAEKGGIWLDLELSGRTAHGSLPHLGANAAAGLAEALVRLERAAESDSPGGLSVAERRLRDALWRPAHPMLGEPTLTLTRLAGGVATNVVPDRATAVLDVRTLPGQPGGAILEGVAGVLEEVAGRRGLQGTVGSRGERVALETPAEHPLVLACAVAVSAATGRAAERCALTGATDATELVPALGAPFVICGPGHMDQAHQPDEWVSLGALEESVEIYEHLARALLGAGG